MDFVKEYASALILMGSVLLAVVYTASTVLQARSELKRIKEAHASEIKYIKEVHAADIKHIKKVHASDIERARAEAAKKAIADLRKEYQHLVEYKPIRRATKESDRDA